MFAVNQVVKNVHTGNLHKITAIEQVQETRGQFCTVYVLVDTLGRLGRWQAAEFIPCHTVVDTPQLAGMFEAQTTE